MSEAERSLHHLQQAIALAAGQLESGADLPRLALTVVRQLRHAGLDFTSLNVYLIDRALERGRNYYIEPGPAGWMNVAFNDTMAPWVAHTEARLRQWRDPESQLPMWYLTVPNVRGAVEICAFRDSPFTPNEISCLQTAAPALTLLALRHCDLEQAALATAAEAGMRADLDFLRLSAADLGGHDPDQVARRVVQSIVERGAFDRAGVFLVDDEQGVLRGTWGIDSHGELADISGTSLPLQCSSPDQLSQAARIVHGTLDHFLTQDLDGEGGRSVEGNIGASLSVPMRLGRRVLGVLSVDNHFTRRSIHPHQVQPLMVLANQTALALDYSRLHLELRRQDESPSAPPTTKARTAPGRSPFDEIVAESEAMRKVVELARLATTTDHTVLILGESGTGKGLLAHASHADSRRRSGPLAVVNSASLSTGLEDSELFGHVKGAFTSAIRDNTGLVGSAHGGTLFLDEIGDLSPSSQAKLLRTLENGEIRRVGDSRVQQVDIRCIAATNRDLRRAVHDSTFRADLYYRLAVVTIWIPPLRERPEDIPVLAARFLEDIAGEMGRGLKLPARVLDLLVRFPWPGNARELHSCLRHAALLAGGRTIREQHLPEELLQAPPPRSAPSESSLAQVERRHILQVLEQCGQDRQLGISRATLQRRLKEYGITP